MLASGAGAKLAGLLLPLSWAARATAKRLQRFFSAEQRFPTERHESVTEVKRMKRLAGAVERFVCGSGGQIEVSKCRAVPGAAFADGRS